MSNASFFRSAGPVQDSETLARFITTPAFIAKPLPGRLEDTFFQEIFTHGMSVQRICTRWTVARKPVHRRGEDFAESRRREERAMGKPPVRKYLGVVHLNAGDVRRAHEAVDVAPRRIRIYNTAEKGNRHHAEVMSDLGSEKAKKVPAKKLG
jgi:hypothetical protein